MQMERSIGERPANYETTRKETNIYEQKPVNMISMILKRLRLRSELKNEKKRRKVAEKNKLLKKRERLRKLK